MGYIVTHTRNDNCDGGGPCTPGIVKVLPTGGDSNLILCRSCWLREIDYRQNRNRSLGEFAKFSTPDWDTATVYET